MSNSNDASIHALAGAGGGVIAYLFTYPLATISTRLQVERTKNISTIESILNVVKNEGWRGLYSGLNAALIGTAATQGVYYYWYETFRGYAEGPTKKRLSDLTSLLIAALAGVITVLITNPIWVVNVRMTLENKKASSTVPSTDKPVKKGIIATFLDILTNEGPDKLWSGVIPALVLVSNPAIQYMIFEKLKIIAEKGRDKPLLPFHFFLMGAIGKIVATIVTYPYIVVKSRLQMKPSDDSQEVAYKDTTDVLKQIWKHEKIPGFYKGLQSKIVQSVLNAAFLFMFKEELVAVVRYTLQLLGALPKATKQIK